MRTSAAAAMVATTALIATGMLTGTASAAPRPAAAGGGPLTAQPLPDVNGRLYDVTQVGAHVTLAGGIAQGVEADGDLAGTPLLLRKDDRDGKGWQTVQLPQQDLGDSFTEINSVAAVPGTAGQAWAVGLEPHTPDCAMPGHEACPPILAYRFDGTSWTAAPVPVPENTAGAGLSQVVANGPSDVWAVGWAYILDHAEPNPPPKPGGWHTVEHLEALLVHWDGHAWTRVAVPDELTLTPTSVAVSGRDVYVAGISDGPAPEVQHWNGRTWTTEKLPAFADGAELYKVGVDAAGSPWAVGRTWLGEDDVQGHGLLLHKTGGVWRKVAVPADAGLLTKLAFTPSGVAVAGSDASDGRSGYVAQSDATGWHQIALPAAPEGGLLATEGMTYSPQHGLTVVGHQEGADGPLGADVLPVVLDQR
ncbi:hypothetical protein [Streptomyces sp. NPDC021020]|uniref:hypothetical protein n=1 Tax=Streptomyces sp. NPDC021020 TaxID=3365109 RepID=UPI0037B895A6